MRAIALFYYSGMGNGDIGFEPQGIPYIIKGDKLYWNNEDIEKTVRPTLDPFIFMNVDNDSEAGEYYITEPHRYFCSEALHYDALSLDVNGDMYYTFEHLGGADFPTVDELVRSRCLYPIHSSLYNS